MIDRLETLICGVRGHEAPAALAGRLRSPQDDGLGFDRPDGTRMARCLRCGMWSGGPPPSGDEVAWEVIPPLETIHVPRTGRALRDAVVMRLIAVDRALHAVVFTLLASALLALQLELTPLQAQARSLRSTLTSAATETGRNPSRDVLVSALDRVLRLHRASLPVLIATAGAYAIVEGTEAVGLWRERRWAEYLTVVATAGFLPFEIHELTKRVTVLRLGALVVNIAVLVYLVWSKRLFGIRRQPS